MPIVNIFRSKNPIEDYEEFYLQDGLPLTIVDEDLDLAIEENQPSIIRESIHEASFWSKIKSWWLH